MRLANNENGYHHSKKYVYTVSKKKGPHFQSDSENKHGVLGNSDLYQSTEELPEFCFKWPISLPLDFIDSEDGYLKTEGLVCSEFGKDRVSSISATCILHTFHKEPPSRISVDAQYQTFGQKWCFFKATSPASPSVPDATVNRVRVCSQSSP
jgi:hypothetical protein